MSAVECYDLVVYCDDLSGRHILQCVGEFTGRNQREAWRELRSAGWTTPRGLATPQNVLPNTRRTLCPECSSPERAPDAGRTT